jgi:HD-GYP domain-containing protein (c-di-GMP phosphodiesterase class II)
VVRTVVKCPRARADDAPVTSAASQALDPELTGLIEDARAREAGPLADRDRRASILVGGAFVAAAVPLAVLAPTHEFSVARILLAVAAYVLASWVAFEIGPGMAVATQIVFVPMLFFLPPGIVPLCVAGALVVRSLLETRSLRAAAERLPLQLVSSWHALGPALVLTLAGDPAFAWHRWPLYLAALAAQFALDSGSAAARQRLALDVSIRSQLRFMALVYGVDAALAPIGLLLVATGHFWSTALVVPLVGLLAVFARERQVRIDHALELSAAYRGTALLLGDVVEADDAYTGSHSRDVVDLVVAVSRELGLSARELRDAEFAALLHDVGKVRIPSEIIRKPGALTPEERKVIETHTVEGEAMLRQVGGLLGEVGRIVRSCHERVDGGGYPDGLAGDEIPLIARIVCCCDAFSAMTTDRPYRAARPVEEALEELRLCAGTQFDTRVVAALERVEHSLAREA